MTLTKEYLDHPAMSQSKLKTILDGVDEFKLNLTASRKQSDAQILGNAVHILLLQPHLVHKIIELPEFASNTREGKIFNFLKSGVPSNFFRFTNNKIKKQVKDEYYEIDAEEAILMQNLSQSYGHYFADPDSFVALSSFDMQRAIDMTNSIMQNEDAVTLIERCTAFEKNYFFKYRGLDFKAQVDAEGEIEGIPFVLDLKTTRLKFNPKKIYWEILENRLNFQAATYLTGTGAKNYFLIFVRNEEPYSVFTVVLSEKMLEMGREDLDQACDIYSDCLQNNPNFIANHRMITI